MHKKILLGAFLLLIFSVSTMIKLSSAADTLSPNDFKLESWSKNIDFFDYVRAYAEAHGKTPPPSNWHANLNLVYINVGGFQLLYGGLANITTGDAALTIPVQTILEHYNTRQGKDVLTSSSFIMLLAFNDTSSSIYPDSPDRNDTLYASFSLGLNLDSYFGDRPRPALSSETTIIPLTHSADNLNWHWGMRYTNMTAVWWRMHIEPTNPSFEALPIAITTYEELTFTYNLTINPSDYTANVTANYVIGRMTNLWLIQWLLIFPIVTHYNSTGTYGLDGTKISDETIYQFLQRQKIKMSVVLFQNSLVLNRMTRSSFNNQNVTDAEVDVSAGEVSTEADDGEKIFEVGFGVKKSYKLYNYTADSTQTIFDTYDSVTRTAKITGYARNPIFATHTYLLRFVPLVVAHLRPQMYEMAKDRMLNMTYADYFYAISYPTYSGFKIEHDPTYTAFVSITTGVSGWQGYLLLALGAATVIVLVTLIARRKRQQSLTTKPE